MSDLESLLQAAQKLRDVLRSSKAVNVNKALIRGQAQSLVQTYFREVRPQIANHVDAAVLSNLDTKMQRLLVLSNAPNLKSSYVTVLREIAKSGTEATFSVEKSKSDIEVDRAKQGNTITEVEKRIYETLLRMLPTAARSYLQALHDLAGARYSYRGPAIELREALREVLDHMAPDEAVITSPGYKQDKNANGPTMAQKARYIMKQRQKTDSVAKPTLEAADIVDAATAKIIRSTYVSGSVSVHVSPTKGDVQQLKMHVDSALAELLGVFV